MFFFGGLQNYRERLKEVVDDNWRAAESRLMEGQGLREKWTEDAAVYKTQVRAGRQWFRLSRNCGLG